jgi:hypothetical protein
MQYLDLMYVCQACTATECWPIDTLKDTLDTLLHGRTYALKDIPE